MEMVFRELTKKIRTREELISVLDELTQKKYKQGRVNEEISGLEKKLLALPELKLEIAFSPADEFINKLSQWAEKELGQKVILDITVNPKAVAGAIIEYRGLFRDFSLSKKIDELTNSRINELTS